MGVGQHGGQKFEQIKRVRRYQTPHQTLREALASAMPTKEELDAATSALQIAASALTTMSFSLDSKVFKAAILTAKEELDSASARCRRDRGRQATYEEEEDHQQGDQGDQGDREEEEQKRPRKLSERKARGKTHDLHYIRGPVPKV